MSDLGFRRALPKHSITQRLARRLIPSALAGGDYRQLRRAGLLVTFSMTLTVFGMAYAWLYLFHYDAPLEAAALLIAAALAVAIAFLPRLGLSLRVASHCLVALVFGILNLLAMTSGGFEGTTMFWLPLVPSLAVMLSGVRSGIVWAFVSVASNSLIYAAQSSGYQFASVIPESAILQAFFSSSLGLCLLIPLLFGLYEIAVGRILHELSMSEQASAQARQQAEQSHSQVKLILDSISDGLALFDSSGFMVGESSKNFQKWFGVTEFDKPVWEQIEEKLPRFATWVELAWLQLQDGQLDPELCLRQIPAEAISIDQKVFRIELRYMKQSNGSDSLHANTGQVLMVVSDITEQVVAKRAEEERSDMVALMLQLMKMRSFTLESMAEIERLLEAIQSEHLSFDEQNRLLHTLKGNASIIGLKSMQRLCHKLEDNLVETRENLAQAERISLKAAWQSLTKKMTPFLTGDDQSVAVYRDDIQKLKDAIERGASERDLLQLVATFSLEPVIRRFSYLSDYILELAEDLQKTNIRVVLEEEGLRLPREAWSQFWGNFIHAIRNAVDHGVDTAESRLLQGKPPEVTIKLISCLVGDQIEIRLEDDGPGIAWEVIRSRAEKRGLSAESHQDLVQALFTDGLSSRDLVTEISGRGVGLAALLQSCQELEGSLDVISELGQGTCFRFRFPAHHRMKQAA